MIKDKDGGTLIVRLPGVVRQIMVECEVVYDDMDPTPNVLAESSLPSKMYDESDDEFKERIKQWTNRNNSPE